MSEQRDPKTDQPLPVDGKENVYQIAIAELDGWNLDTDVQQGIEDGLVARRELGIRKYGKPLQTHNGRDVLKDAWEEALDLFVYVYQMELEDPGSGIADGVLWHAESALEELTRMRLERGDNLRGERA